MNNELRMDDIKPGDLFTLHIYVEKIEYVAKEGDSMADVQKAIQDKINEKAARRFKGA